MMRRCKQNDVLYFWDLEFFTGNYVALQTINKKVWHNLIYIQKAQLVPVWGINSRDVEHRGRSLENKERITISKQVLGVGFTRKIAGKQSDSVYILKTEPIKFLRFEKQKNEKH